MTLDRLAAVADASPSTVTRLFRRHLGSSPLAWVLDVRIGVAKTLLTATTLPVNQIAHGQACPTPTTSPASSGPARA